MRVEAGRRHAAIALAGTVVLASVAGLLYACALSIPARLAVPLTAAFAVEAGLYVAVCLERVRKRLAARLGAPALALVAAASALAPYAIYSLPTGEFSWRALGLVGALAAGVSFWYVVLPRRPAIDLLFLALVAAALLGPVFPAIYTSPTPRVPVGILGQVMWTRLAIFECLAIAGMSVRGFSLLPRRKDWAAGTLNFLLFLPVGALLGWALGCAGLHVRPAPWWQTLGLAILTFAGMLWVVALREEFFFRGLLQEWLQSWMRSEMAALAAASVLFGLAHLPFRGFPNWRFAALAAVAGFFYGRAYLAARSVRAAMVTHALVNTVWRVFFS
ncbi:MAG: CPBP family intramembrane glutamic endopeptidase [Bryobacteraceae bacterium]